jgi:predicted RecB family nuclease
VDTPSIEHINVFMDQNFVDLLEYSRKLALKSSSYSIKQLAPLANFYWSVDNPGGAISLVKYKVAVNENTLQSDKKDAIDWLINYNKDDARATFAVRNFLRRIQVSHTDD